MDIREVVSGSFEMPAQVAFDLPRIMILGDGSIFVENYLALAEYKKNSVKLVTKSGLLEISGDDFEIKVMQQNNIALCGKFYGLKIV